MRAYIAYPEVDLVLELGRFFAYMIIVKVRAHEDLNSKIIFSLSRFVSQHNGTGENYSEAGRNEQISVLLQLQLYYVSVVLLLLWKPVFPRFEMPLFSTFHSYLISL